MDFKTLQNDILLGVTAILYNVKSRDVEFEAAWDNFCETEEQKIAILNVMITLLKNHDKDMRKELLKKYDVLITDEECEVLASSIQNTLTIYRFQTRGQQKPKEDVEHVKVNKVITQFHGRS